MTVMEKNRIIKDSWVFGVCENCGHNPKKIKMVKEVLFSGDPQRKYKTKKKIWTCARCGYTREL